MQLLGMPPDMGNQEILIFPENRWFGVFFFQESRQMGFTKNALSYTNLKQKIHFPQITFVTPFQNMLI